MGDLCDNIGLVVGCPPRESIYMCHCITKLSGHSYLGRNRFYLYYLYTTMYVFRDVAREKFRVGYKTFMYMHICIYVCI